MTPLQIAHEDIDGLAKASAAWDPKWTRVLVDLGINDLSLQHTMWLVAKHVKKKSLITELKNIVDSPEFSALSSEKLIQHCGIALNLCKRIPVRQLSSDPNLWDNEGEDIRNKRYPNIILTASGEIYYENAFTEHYYNPTTGETDTICMNMSLTNRRLLSLPDIPFEQHYADPFGRVPIPGIPTDYRPWVRDLDVEWDTVMLRKSRALTVANAANQIVRNSRVKGMYGLTPVEYIKQSRVPIPTLIRDPLLYALGTRPALPNLCGEFIPVPVLMLALDDSHWDIKDSYDVTWVSKGFPKATIKLQYTDYGRINLVYDDDERPINDSLIKDS